MKKYLICFLIGFIVTVHPVSAADNFLIPDPPSTINSNASFLTLVQLTDLTPNVSYYLAGTFYKKGSTNYFGKTLVDGNWIKNNSSATSQFKITSDNSGNWVGSLEVMPDSSNSDFTGSGQYDFKVARYNSTGDNLTWSNNVSLTINYIAEPTPTPTQLPESTPKAAAQPSAIKTTTTTSLTPGSISNSFFRDSATVAGIATTSSQTKKDQVLEQFFTDSKPSINWWLIGGGFLALCISGIPLVKIFKNKLPQRIQIRNWKI